MHSNGELSAQKDGGALVLLDLVELLGLLVQRLLHVQIGAVLGLGAILSVDLQRTVFDLFCWFVFICCLMIKYKSIKHI